jgi:hypothetical protein
VDAQKYSWNNLSLLEDFLFQGGQFATKVWLDNNHIKFFSDIPDYN